MTTRSTPTTTAPSAVTVHITPNALGSPAGKIADAELHFEGGPLHGMRLLGFAIWERRNGAGRNVTHPARTYSVNGERRSFSLLRPQGGAHASVTDAIRDLILAAYDAQQNGPEASAVGASQAAQADRTTL